MTSPASPVLLEFPSNSLLQDLCGHHDTHLQIIEEGLGVQVVPRGNQLAVFGPPHQTDLAKQALMGLYDLLKQGVALSPSQVQATLRLTDGLITPEEPAATLLAGPAVITTPQMKFLPRTHQQARYIKTLAHHTLTFGVGPAGTGKTALATAYAVQLLVAKQVSRIILTRPVLEAGERLGFLPGTFEEKIDPYLRPLFDTLDETLGRERWQKLRETSVIEIAPLAYMRGRTIKNAAMVLDEAQNTTPIQMKMFLTRMGEGSRMMVTGDLTQCDLPRGQRNGLKDSLEVLEGLRDIGVTRFGEADVVRHPLVSSITSAYAERERQLNFRLEE